MSEPRKLIAESNWEMWETRDPHGARHIIKQNRSHEPTVTQEQTHADGLVQSGPEYSRARQTYQRQHQCLGHTELIKKSKAPRRRTLPPTPGSPAHTERKAELAHRISANRAIHQHPDDLYEEERQRRAGPYPKTIQPLGPDSLTTYDGTPKDYYDPPKVETNAERGQWAWGLGLGSSVAGADIAPCLGLVDRHYQQQQQFSDRHLLQSLRVPSDPNCEWRMDKIRAKIMVEDEHPDDGDLPDVFIRLIDPRLYTGAHKKRFKRKSATEWVGAGIEGRRDDTLLEVAIAGESQILRTDEPEMDAPNKHYMPWDIERMHPDAYYTRNINPDHTVEDVVTNERMSQIINEKSKIHVRDGGDYEAERKERASWCVDKEHSKFWEQPASA